MVIMTRSAMDARESAERAARIKACMHETSHGVGLGYALCDDCGALLPDEDPDLRAKCEPKE